MTMGTPAINPGSFCGTLYTTIINPARIAVFPTGAHTGAFGNVDEIVQMTPMVRTRGRGFVAAPSFFIPGTMLDPSVLGRGFTMQQHMVQFHLDMGVRDSLTLGEQQLHDLRSVLTWRATSEGASVEDSLACHLQCAGTYIGESGDAWVSPGEQLIRSVSRASGSDTYVNIKKPGDDLITARNNLTRAAKVTDGCGAINAIAWEAVVGLNLFIYQDVHGNSEGGFSERLADSHRIFMDSQRNAARAWLDVYLLNDRAFREKVGSMALDTTGVAGRTDLSTDLSPEQVAIAAYRAAYYAFQTDDHRVLVEAFDISAEKSAREKNWFVSALYNLRTAWAGSRGCDDATDWSLVSSSMRMFRANLKRADPAAVRRYHPQLLTMERAIDALVQAAYRFAGSASGQG